MGRRVPRIRLWVQNNQVEKGNAVASFALITPMVLFVLFALMSLIYALHIRFTLEDVVFEGAKTGSLADGDILLAESRTRDALEHVFEGEYCAHADIEASVLPDRSIEVSLHCPAQNNLWFGNFIPEMTVSSYARIE